MSVAEPGATDGFVTLRAASCFVQTEVRFESVVRELGLLEPGGLAGLVARGGGPSSRTGNVILELDALDVRLHVRPLRHGGLAGDAARKTPVPNRSPARRAARPSCTTQPGSTSSRTRIRRRRTRARTLVDRRLRDRSRRTGSRCSCLPGCATRTRTGRGRSRGRLALHRLGYRRGAARRRASTWSSKAPPSSM